MLATFIGGAAALLTSLSYIPQIWKAWRTQETGDISYGMLAILGSGLCLWVGYGLLQADWVVVASNIVAVVLISTLALIKFTTKR